MSTSEKKVREIEGEINEINSKLEDANAAIRSTQRKLNIITPNLEADPTISRTYQQELQNRLAKQQAEVDSLNAQLAAKEKEANEVADREPTAQPTTQENTAAAGQTAETAVNNEEESSTTEEESPTTDEEDIDEELDDEEQENLENENEDPDSEETEDETGTDVVVGFDEDGNPVYETDEAGDETGTDVVVGFDKYGNPVYEGEDITDQTSSVPVYIPMDNPLHDYASYTYNVSLFVLSSDEYNKAVKGVETWERVGQCLIGGAGRFNDTNRHPAFRDDFFFDGLRLTTVVGLNQKSKSSNAIDITFNLIEPYGLTLLDRIIDVAETVKPRCRNYLELPYLLQIDFFGSTDDGEMPNPIPGITKRLPIKIIELKMKVGTKGTEYALKAIPFNHQALQETTASTPINLEIDAATVKDFFDEGEAITITDTNEIAAYREAIKLDIIKSDPDVLKIYEARLIELEKGARVKATSYTAGVNAWYQQQLITGARNHTDQIRFVVDEEIGKSLIVLPDRNDPSKTPVPDPGTAKARVINSPNASGPDFNTSAFSISAGTSVLKLVDMVMRNSKYVLDQVSDPASKSAQDIANSRGKPLFWYKVVPDIQLNQFDSRTNRWSKTITYHIKKMIVYNSKHPMGPQSLPNGAVKQYNYLYTGYNRDILDFSIDFDALFYTAVEVNRASYQTISGAASSPDTGKINDIQNPSDPGSIQQSTYIPIPDNPAAGAVLDGNRDSATKTASSIQNSIYSNARGDMLNLRIKIIGDPHFIKQDDVLINPADKDYETQTNQQLIPGVGSLVMDRGEIFVRVNFRTPVDMDDTTGLVRQDGRYIESKFSGLYRVLTVDSEFRSGKFEQVLNMVRIFEDILKPGVVANDRQDESTTDRDQELSVKSTDDIEDSSGVTGIDDTTSDETIEDDDSDLRTYGEEDDPFDPDANNESEETDEDTEDLEEIVDSDSEEDIGDVQEQQASSAEQQPANTAAQFENQQQQTQEQKVRAIESEVSRIDTELGDAEASVRATQRKLERSAETPNADPVLRQELQNQLARQQAQVVDLKSQLAAKEAEADTAAQ
jgi:hypothetical protein